MGIKYITITEVEKLGRGGVWVMNTAKYTNLGPEGFRFEGDVLIDIPRQGGGKPLELKVPNSWLPFECTAQIPRQMLMDSPEFRSALNKGLISLISEQTAHRLNTEDGAHEERQRLLGLDRKVRTESAPPRSSKHGEIKLINRDAGDDDESNSPMVDVYGPDGRRNSSKLQNLAVAAKAGVQVDDDGLKPSFKAWAEKTATESDVSAMNAIRSRGKFTSRELKHMRGLLTAHPKARNLIRDRLAEIRARKNARAA